MRDPPTAWVPIWMGTTLARGALVTNPAYPVSLVGLLKFKTQQDSPPQHRPNQSPPQETFMSMGSLKYIMDPGSP